MAETAFTWGNAGEKLTPSERRRKVAEAMILRGTSTAPIQHWTQGAARVAEALMGQYDSNQMDKADKAGQASVAADAALLMGGGATPSASIPAATGASPTQKVSYAPGGDRDPNPALDAIEKFESGGRNIHQNIVPAGGGFNPSTGTVTGPSSAQGHFQMITPTWRSAAKMAGIDTAQYPTAMTAPYELQRKAAAALYAKEGFAPWAPYNAALRSHIAKNKLASNEADMPAATAAVAEAPSGQSGFVIPPGERPVESIPGDDPAKLRAEAQTYAQTNPEAARQMLARADAAEAASAPAMMPPPRPADLAVAPPPAPGMTAQAFNAITSGEPPLDPAFQAEGVAQPWMGTAIPPQAAQPPMVAQAPMPPPRPADLPAPGAVEAIGQMPPQAAPQPQMMPDLSNSPDGGMRQLQMQAEQARQSQPAAPQEAMNPLARVAAAFTGGGQQAAPAAAPSPAVANVAQAVGSPAAPASPGVDRVASAMRVLNSPYAQPGQRAIAQMVVAQAFKDPTEIEGKKLDLEIKRKTLAKDDKPNDVREYEYAKGQGYAGTFENYQRDMKQAGRTTVNVNGGGSDKQIFDTVKESSDGARSAAIGLSAVREARAAIKGGAFLGAGADAKLQLQKIGASLGVADPGKIVNTETFRSAIAPAVASLLKSTVGSANISNSDREFAEKAAGGSITLDEGTITRLLDIMERGNVTILEGHQKRMDAIYPDEVTNKRERALFGVPMPAAPARKPSAASPDRSALEAEARRRGLIK